MMNVVTRFGRQLLDNQTEKGAIYVRENIGNQFFFIKCQNMGLMHRWPLLILAILLSSLGF